MRVQLIKNMSIAIIGLSVLVACSTPEKAQRTVSRVDPNQTIDLSGKWNDTDSRLVAEQVISDALTSSWLSSSEYQAKQPVITFGNVVNKTTDHIDVTVFLNDMQRAIIRSGKAKFIATKKNREELRQERRDQQQYAREETVKQMAAETGADVMIQGQISSIIDKIEGQRVIFYQIDLEGVDIETGEIIWVGQNKIKKLIEQDKWQL